MIELVSPNELLFFISIILVIIGGVVGMLGSHHAVRKYLKIWEKLKIIVLEYF